MRQIFFFLFILATSPASVADTPQKNNLLAAVTDIFADKVCDRLEQHFRSLKSEVNNVKLTSGTMFIDACNITHHNTENSFTMQFSGKGWRWIHRERSKMNAEFEMSQYIPFSFEAALQGQLSADYDPVEKKAYLWFAQSQPPEVNFTPLADIDVDKESTWAAILSGVGSLIGQSAEERASDKVASKGKQKLKQKLNDGFSVGIDLCTGRTATELSRIDKIQLNNAIEQQHQAHSETYLIKKNTLYITGDYVQGAALTVSLEQSDKSQIKVSAVCKEEALTIANAFIKNNSTANQLSLSVMEFNHNNEARVESLNCPSTLIIHPADASTRVTVSVRELNIQNGYLKCQ